jgi:thymidylate kinase
MATIALIGPDGAGKTTISRMLADYEPLRIKYLYMGVAAESGNVVLPTTRLAEWLKRRQPKRATRAPAGFRQPGMRAGLRSMARLANRLLEEWYRQLVSWYYQASGCVVLYDRHYLFDFAREIVDPAAGETFEQRLHRRVLEAVYPRPDMVIFLDAPAELLFQRKGELTVPELERRRQAFLRQGERLSNFVRVDATRPITAVHDEVLEHVISICPQRALRVPAPQR